MAKGTGFVACTNCLGSGATTTMEIYNDNGKMKTRTVRKVCSICTGSGGFHV